MYDNRPIGIFDSGVGGLSIYQVVKKHLPQESFVYLADQANNPYGGRPEKEIQKLASNVVSFLAQKNVKIVIVACNTATVHAINELRSVFAIPIIGVVPVVKTLSRNTKSGKVAVFSTPATAKSTYLSNLIKKFAPNIEVYKVGSSGLEHLVEQGVTEGREIDKALKIALIPLVAKDVDSIALGCTHYPFIESQMKKVLGSKIKIYDSGIAVARRTKQVLENENILAKRRVEDYFYTTGDDSKFKKVAEKLLGEKLAHVEKAVI